MNGRVGDKLSWDAAFLSLVTLLLRIVYDRVQERLLFSRGGNLSASVDVQELGVQSHGDAVIGQPVRRALALSAAVLR